MKNKINMNTKLIRPSLLFLAICILSFSNCTYNSEEDLYPIEEPQDVTSYSADILPIVETNCYVCHQDGATCGDINLQGYDNLVVRVEDGSLLGSIKHEEGWSAMPQGASKLSDSQIQKVSDWIDQDYPNN